MLLAPLVAYAVHVSALRSAMAVPACYVGKTVWKRPEVTEKVIALTFDDGPSPLTTPLVLDTLKAHHAKATFFLVGQMIRNREAIVRRIVSEGHVVGNHTHRHRFSKTKEDALEEVSFANRAIHRAIGVYPTLFRPPGGQANSWTSGVAKSEGMTSVIWNGAGFDSGTATADQVARNVLSYVKPGAIILMHDVKAHTAAALPRILDSLDKQGYKCVSVPELLRYWEAAEKEPATRAVAKLVRTNQR